MAQVGFQYFKIQLSVLTNNSGKASHLYTFRNAKIGGSIPPLGTFCFCQILSNETIPQQSFLCRNVEHMWPVRMLQMRGSIQRNLHFFLSDTSNAGGW